MAHPAGHCVSRNLHRGAWLVVAEFSGQAVAELLESIEGVCQMVVVVVVVYTGSGMIQ